MMNPASLLQLQLMTQKCTLGCPVLDRCLGGGIPCNSLTELVGESGSGKTQFCLQLVLAAQLPPSRGGLYGSSFYIYTEFPFPKKRLRELCSKFRSSHKDLFPSDGSNGDDPCDRVLIQGVSTADKLFEEMRTIESYLVHSKSRLPIRVIVIDSIAALFRSDFDNTPLDLKRRSSLFFKISGKLKWLAKRFGLAVVVTNQVVDVIGANEGINGLRIGNLAYLYSSGRRVCPALGLGWASCVNSRLFLSRNEETSWVNEGGVVYQRSNTKRRISVVFAPHLPECSCEFEIHEKGVSGVEWRQ
ncbi:hypothetical protein L6164_014068 [Bauhinia variegata]|uniref:Uncharacterized protein n=1 Tax=Bauhinia variegata TaxID=167791 RepID=A0ACB9NGD0_BAUVA|nr:hypothetical protein L6164_014068 [Bauhinia variegata]